MRGAMTSLVGVAVWLAVAAAPVRAHHAFAAEFDANKPVTLRGTVSKVEWTNPHMWLHVDVPRSDGAIVTWAIEGGAPNALFRRGFRRDSLPVGIVVTVEGFQAKSGKAVANGREVVYPDGVKLMMGSSGTGAPGDKPDR
jgi:uncharacterized protein DUF6152